MAEYEVSRFDYKDNTYKFKDASARADIEELQQQAEVDAKAVGDVSQTTTSTTLGPSPIVTFDASVADMPLKGLTVDIEPVQDLHGYDHPWPGGGGKNLVNREMYTSRMALADDGTIVSSGNTASISEHIPVIAGETYSFSLVCNSTGYKRIAAYKANGDFISPLLVKLTGITVGELRTASFIAPTDAAYVIVGNNTTDTNVQLELSSTVTAYEPYSNICPITGWTGCNVERAGKNLFDFANADWVSGSLIDSSGAVISNGNYRYCRNYNPIHGGKVITVSFIRTGGATALGNPLAFYDKDKNFLERISTVAADGVEGRVSKNISVPSGAAYYRLNIANDIREISDYMIEYGDTPTTYEPFGAVYSITFPTSAGTVYGGTLDVTNGAIIATHTSYTIDENQGFADRISNQNRVYFKLDSMNTGTWVNDPLCVCDRLPKGKAESGGTTLCISIGIDNQYIYIGGIKNIPGVTDMVTFKTWLASNPISFTYPVQQPVTQQITPFEITTLLGENNIWADTGDVTVTYGAYLETVKAHVDNEDKTTRAMLAPVEEGSTASANYAIGDMLVFSGKLCKATATIASGDTLAIGTNLTSTTVENELKANYVLPASGIPKADLAADVQKSLDAANASMFLVNGTNTSQLFKFWWSLSDPEEGRYARLEKFFALLADSWANKKYTLKWYKASVSSSSVMTPIDDLEGKSAAQLCTDVTSPVEDWADEDPMTWYVRANALSLADGTMNILAIEGLDDDFDLTGETAPVWTFSMALWKKEWELGDYKYKSWATTQLDEYYKPYAGDVDPNTNKKRIMTWRPTFPGSLTADGTKLTSGIGGKPYLFVGAATAITKARAMDAYEGLWNDADTIWVLDMWQLRHFNLENSGICEGCQSYDYSPTIAVAETGVTRVLLTTANAANYQVGSNVSIGTDRANNIRTILSKEDVEVGGTTYTALNLDGEAFDTETSQKVFTMPWSSGNTENLPGHKDGACHSLTAGQNPMRVQGVEMMSGAYDIGLDPLYNVTNFANSKGDYAVFECRDSEKLAGSITADYEDTGISYAQMPKGWNYPKTFAETDKAILFPAELGGSTSAYYKSGFSGAYSAGVRCPWRCGGLDSGASAGLACEFGNATPSHSYWLGRPRLSGSGKKRGVWTA